MTMKRRKIRFEYSELLGSGKRWSSSGLGLVELLRQMGGIEA